MIDILAVSIELFLLIVLLMLIWHCRTLRRRSVEDNYRFQQEVESLEMQNIRLEDAGLKLYELKNALVINGAIDFVVVDKDPAKAIIKKVNV